METQALRDPAKTALVAAGERISYRELLERANRMAGALQGLGLKKGDRLALLMHNCPEFVISFYAAMKLGLLAVSLNVMFKQEEAAYILEDSGPRALVVHEDYLPVVRGVEAARRGWTEKIVVSRRAAEPEAGIPFHAFLARSAEEPPVVEPGPEAEAVIAYTSGTTGFPKGVVHTHENILVHLEGIRRHLAFGPGDVFLAALPFFQLVAFLIHPILALHAGATVVILEKFEAKTFLQAVKEEGVSFFAAVPTIYHMIRAASETIDADLGTVRFGICAGSPLSRVLREAFEKRFSFRIIHCYGMTEISLIAACENPESEPEGVSVGNVMPYVRLRIASAGGGEAGEGEAGEIQVGAERALRHYWNAPEETARALKGGWFATGDIGRIDGDGLLHIVDRKKDMIIRGGFNVFPAEIERVLLADERVAEAAVIGIPHARLGEVPKAFVALKEGAEATEDEMKALIREKLASFKALEEVEFVAPGFFPRNALGKILKAALRPQGSSAASKASRPGPSG
jgi:long-chain acyl-CoA synthetase